MFISTGELSGKAVKILTCLGLEVQKDLQVVGLDRQIDTVANISIPYVKQSMESIGQCAFDILLNQIKNKSTESVDCRLQTDVGREIGDTGYLLLHERSAGNFLLACLFGHGIIGVSLTGQGLGIKGYATKFVKVSW